MKYIPAEIPVDLSGTRAGVLWAAANIAITEPAIDDAVAEAAHRAGIHGEPTHTDADACAVRIAQSRVPSAHLNPAWPSRKWWTWQSALDETWPILADAAASQEAAADRRIGLTPGRWEA